MEWQNINECGDAFASRWSQAVSPMELGGVWECGDAECAEVAAGAGLVGADLGVGAGGAVEAGGLEPGVEVGLGSAQLVGQLEGALGAVGAQGAGVEQESRYLGQVGGHIEALVGHGMGVGQPGVGAGDAQAVAVDFGGDAVGDMARPLRQQEAFGAECPGARLLVPAQGAIVPVGFDEGVAGRLVQGLFGDAREADVDGLGQLCREAVGEGQLGAVLLLRRSAWVGGAIELFLDLLAVEHHIDFVAPTAVLQSIGIYLRHRRVLC